MTRLTALEEARIELAARIYERLEDGNLDEGLKSALMKGGLAAGLAAGALGGGAKFAGKAAKAPQAVTQQQAPVKKTTKKAKEPSAHQAAIMKKYDPGYDAAIKATRGFIKDMEASNKEMGNIRKQGRNQSDAADEKAGREMFKKMTKPAPASKPGSQGTFFGDKRKPSKTSDRGVFTGKRRR